jgi:hypothetical protein
LYDSLLDELEDDVVSNPQEVEELADKVVDAEEADADLLVDDADAAVIPDADIEAEAESEIEASGRSGSHTSGHRCADSWCCAWL